MEKGVFIQKKSLYGKWVGTMYDDNAIPRRRSLYGAYRREKKQRAAMDMCIQKKDCSGVNLRNQESVGLVAIWSSSQYYVCER